jgi:hypothetical protein
MTICHRTASEGNPFVVITVSRNAGGHWTHPEKGGRNDSEVSANSPKGPTFKSGFTGCDDGPPPPPPPPPPPEPECIPPDPDCPNGEPVIPPVIIVTDGEPAAPAEPVRGRPTVTG